MALRDILEDFATQPSFEAPPPPVVQEPDPQVIEAAKKEAFAEGYLAGQQAGREEADAERTEKLDRISQLLADMDFSAAEVEVAMAARVTPVLSAIVASVLPRAIAAGLPVAVEEELNTVARSAMEGPLTLRVSQSYAEILEGLPQIEHQRVTLVFDEALDEQTILVQSPHQERLIDFGTATAALEEAVRAFAESHQDQQSTSKELKYG